MGRASDRRVPTDDMPWSEAQWPIEQRGKPGVDGLVAAPYADKQRRYRRLRVKDFADRCQIRIDPARSRMPFCPEPPADVRKRIDAVAVQSGDFRPPDAVLQQILLDSWVFRVHVRQVPEEPAFSEILFHLRRGVRV